MTHKMPSISKPILALALLIFWTCGSVWANPKESQEAIKLEISIQGSLNDLTFDFKPTVIVKNDQKATLQIIPEDEEGNYVTVVVQPKFAENNTVDLVLSFDVHQTNRSVERTIQMRTTVGAPGLYSVTDKTSKEFLKVGVTPTVVPLPTKS